MSNYTASEVLAMLHAGLRNQADKQSLRAIAIAEDVTVTLPGQQPTQAIKVLFEHKNGLTIALYQPISRAAGGTLEVGPYSVIEAKPEVNAWKK